MVAGAEPKSEVVVVVAAGEAPKIDGVVDGVPKALGAGVAAERAAPKVGVVAPKTFAPEVMAEGAPKIEVEDGPGADVVTAAPKME